MRPTTPRCSHGVVVNRPPIRCRSPVRVGLLVFGLLGLSVACTTGHGAIAPEELNNLSYHGIYDHPVTLNGGVYEGEPFVPGGASRPRVVMGEIPPAAGDLDADGTDDIAVLLTETSGGSGVHTYLAVVSWRDGYPHNVATRLIGDRVHIHSLIFDQGTVVLEFVTSGRTDPACCPTFKMRKAYRLQAGMLVESSSEPLGPRSLRDLEGITWTLTRFGQDEAVPDGIHITAGFTAGRISGTAGCNRYFASVTEAGPGEVKVGLVGSTKMACPPPVMQVEDRYLRMLQQVHRFSFVSGQLVLTSQDSGISDNLLFTPSK